MSRGYFRMPIDTSRVHHSPFAEAGNALPVFFKWREKKTACSRGICRHLQYRWKRIRRNHTLNHTKFTFLRINRNGIAGNKL